MAIVVESVTTVAFGTGDKVFTKPTGLAVGDLMIVHIGGDFDLVGDITAPAGWTDLVEDVDGGGPYGHGAYYKVANSTDVAATDFTFDIGEGHQSVGAIYRISGAGATFVTDNDTTTATTSHTFTGGVTPEAASSLLLFLVIMKNNGLSNGHSDYAVATDNPSWTEQYDIDSTSVGLTFSGATAIRTQTTATGNYSYTSTRSEVAKGMLIALRPSLSASATITSIALTLTMNSPANLLAFSPIALTLTLNSPTAETAVSDWTNATKTSVLSAANTSKNAASPSNVSKSSGSIVNVSKS